MNRFPVCPENIHPNCLKKSSSVVTRIILLSMATLLFLSQAPAQAVGQNQSQNPTSNQDFNSNYQTRMVEIPNNRSRYRTTDFRQPDQSQDSNQNDLNQMPKPRLPRLQSPQSNREPVKPRIPAPQFSGNNFAPAKSGRNQTPSEAFNQPTRQPARQPSDQTSKPSSSADALLKAKVHNVALNDLTIDESELQETPKQLNLPKKGETSENSLLSGPGQSLTQTLGSLALIVGGFLVIVFVLKGKKKTVESKPDLIEVLYRTSLTPKQQIQMVRWGERLLLIAISASNVETLAEISDPAEVHRILLLCDKPESTAMESVFQNLLRAKSGAESSPRAATNPRPAMEPQPAQYRTERVFHA